MLYTPGYCAHCGEDTNCVCGMSEDDQERYGLKEECKCTGICLCHVSEETRAELTCCDWIGHGEACPLCGTIKWDLGPECGCGYDPCVCGQPIDPGGCPGDHEEGRMCPFCGLRPTSLQIERESREFWLMIRWIDLPVGDPIEHVACAPCASEGWATCYC